jgi:hypothetical protein
MSQSAPGNTPAGLPVIAAAGRAYADTRAALAAMPDMLLVGLIASCVYAAIDILMKLDAAAGTDPSVSVVALTTLIGLVWNFFVTPICIAVHRYILLGEITPRYRLEPSGARFSTYFLWAAALTVGGALPGLLGLGLGPNASGVGGVLGFALLLAFFVASVRLLILFPAIAVDAPGANWRNAFADGRGHFWRMFAIVFITLVPLIVAGLLVAAIFGEGAGIVKIVWSLGAFLGGVLGVAVSSRLYQALGQRLDALS